MSLGSNGIYIKRLLVTTAEIEQLGAGLGVRKPQDPPHVTLIYSRSAVDWDIPVFDVQMAYLEVPPQKVSLTRFGSHLVVKLKSSALHERYRDLVGHGAVSDHPEFQPHITVGMDPEGKICLDRSFELTKPLVFGPELRKIPKECLDQIKGKTRAEPVRHLPSSG